MGLPTFCPFCAFAEAVDCAEVKIHYMHLRDVPVKSFGNGTAALGWRVQCRKKGYFGLSIVKRLLYRGKVFYQSQEAITEIFNTFFLNNTGRIIKFRN